MAGVAGQNSLAVIFLEDRLHYDGSQMAAQWAYRKTGRPGDSIVAFEGSCEVKPEQMLDLEDLTAGSVIQGPHMLHFIVEHFDLDLEKAVLRQRLLASIVGAELERRIGRVLRRDGDDLYDEKRKLTISIAALTGVSSKIHFAINVKEAKGVGVPTQGLAAYKIQAREFGEAILKAYAREMEGVHLARVKARPIS
jgi:hypothetical protein